MEAMQELRSRALGYKREGYFPSMEAGGDFMEKGGIKQALEGCVGIERQNKEEPDTNHSLAIPFAPPSVQQARDLRPASPLFLTRATGENFQNPLFSGCMSHASVKIMTPNFRSAVRPPCAFENGTSGLSNKNLYP